MMPSWQELLPILVILIIIFGARKLPEIGSGLGKGIKEFKKSVRDEEDDAKKQEAKSEPIEAEVEEEKNKKEN
jgi:sec-independent protein translocase protein TatA